MSVSNSVDSSPHKSRREQQFCAHIDSIKKQLQSGQLNEAKCIAAFDPILDTFRKSDSELLLCEICDLFLFVFSHENRSHFFDTRDLLQLLVTKLIVRQTSLKSQLKLLKCIKAILKVKESDFANINSNLVLSLVNKVNEQQSARIVEKIDSDNEDIMTEISWSRVVLNTVRILKHIISGRKLENIEKLLNNILGFLKFYIFYGLPGYIVNKAHIGPLYASHLNQYIPDEMANSSPNEKKQKSQKRRKQRKKKFGKNDDADDREDEIDVLSSNEFNKGTTTPSDSEQSASEYVNQSPINLRPILKQSNAKIRINSYECLCCIVQQAEKKFIFGYWSSFIPDNSGVGTTEFSVLTSILKDPTLKARRIALCFLREMLISGKHFVLTLAEEKRNHSKHPFTTLSQTLASMITEIHRCFYLLLFAETNTDVLLQALKCMSTLISVTPYNRFDSGLLTTLLNKSICLLNCERQVQNSCLALFITAFSLRPLPNEFVNWSNSEGNQHIENLLNFCFEKTSSMESIVLCNESLTFLSTFLASNISHKSLSLTKVMNLAINISSHELALINPVIQSNFFKNPRLGFKVHPNAL
ncbi:hypothetical protein B4U79_17235 [Dinothrombium tinctorium]|uniref:DUF4042 domain-containing protein n=1 Tax=Dinothrombium tinctorium TaxID=1965070 RepID=A0A3S3PFW5_9ACAR|nr:hypothetical protein B4U79_17297 [Dinothrombium tinctorium]RWS14391.1 hypothetical protein B4U79_17296 [Dinothrombium tinctorium]RWS15262.1 hypothetical protein B4U79_17235 [Dinothrombium tinctorium]